ncbi:hypothetical protein HY837_02235 [archaeon]|nr:hypothetical protein [archaeon]
MKKSKQLSETHLVLGALLIVSLLGLSLIWFESGATGHAVLTKATYTKTSTTSTKTTTDLNKAALVTKEKILSPTASSRPPVSSAPQPAPPPRDENQCTQCGKQLEYRTMKATCVREQDENVLTYTDPGINANCGNSRPSILHSEEYRNSYITASCADGAIISYGGRCSVEPRLDIPESHIIELVPTGHTLEGTPENSWWFMPDFSQVRLTCSENGDLELYITCVREKRSK